MTPGDRGPLPWLEAYPAGIDVVADPGTALANWDAAVARDRDGPCVIDGSRTHSWSEIDAAAEALASWMVNRGVPVGSRVGILLQNDVEWVISLLGTWKASAVAVALNPMFKERELSYHLSDSGAETLISLDELTPIVTAVLSGSPVSRVLIVERGGDGPLPEWAERFSEAISFPPADIAARSQPDNNDVAILTYTSGTTGTPKGAMNTQGNLAYSAAVGASWYQLNASDVILGVAPLFHITGLVLHLALSWRTGATLVLFHRFDPHEALAAAEKNGATFTVGSITVFMALLDRAGMTRASAPTLTKLASGGAPIASKTLERYEEITGRYIHNVYGMTETTSPSHGVPLGLRAPVDSSGAVSVGIPVPGAIARILDFDTDVALAPGEVGEISVEGPMVVPGYWNNPEATESTMPGGVLRTGDVGLMDEDGWFYVVDRAKDVINASGFKVWPREVEDVLYEHPDVREVIVVGVDDDYRGETVKAFVVLAAGSTTTPDELIEFCKERMAAYKYPRSVELRSELPKTPTGKYLRRAMREN